MEKDESVEEEEGGGEVGEDLQPADISSLVVDDSNVLPFQIKSPLTFDFCSDPMVTKMA